MKINIGCGHNKRKGFVGIDMYKTPATDMVVELLQFPWPLESDSVEEVYCEHFFERVPKDVIYIIEIEPSCCVLYSFAYYCSFAPDQRNRCYYHFLFLSASIFFFSAI